jgi:putative transposase
MPRAARIVVPGVPHHVIQRGNNRQDVFFADDDRRFYLRTLCTQSQRFGLRVTGYCLMTNHVHLIAEPDRTESLARAIGSTHLIFTQYINRLHERIGHLWQDRFYSCPMDPHHTLAAMRYIERNPVRARMVRCAWRYPWSSAAIHCGESPRTRDDIPIDPVIWRQRYPPEDWRKILRDPDDEAFIDRLRHQTTAGRPLGSDRFIAKLEAALNRRLRPRPRGRPAAAAKGSRKRKRHPK